MNPTRTLMRSWNLGATTLGVLALALGTACTPESSSAARGTVTDEDGSAQMSRLAGQGTIEATERVRASAIDADGETRAIGEGEVDADGRFAFDVEPDHGPVVLHALDSDGAVVAAALLEATGEAGDEVTSTPMDVESSVEAYVFLAAEARGDVSLADLRAWIDAGIASAVHASASASGEAETEIEGLATSVLAAQETEARAWAALGLSAGYEAMAEGGIAASQALSVALDAGEDAEASHEAFLEALAALRAEHGLDEAAQSEVATQASMAFRLTLGASVDSEEVVFAGSHAAATLEARATTTVVAAIVGAAEVSTEARDTALDACDALTAEVSAAASLEALIAAYADYQASLVGESEVEGSVLDQLLVLDASAVVEVETTLDAAVEAAASLGATLDAGVSAMHASGDALDPEEVAALVIETWAAFRAEVDAAFAESSDLSPHVSAALVIEATGSFRGGDGAID